MNPPAKLVAFLALLAVVFGVSYFTGTQSQALLAPAPTHNSEMVTPAGTVEGYAMRAVQPTQEPGQGRAGGARRHRAWRAGRSQSSMRTLASTCI